MGLSFLAGLAWLFVAGAACLLSAAWLKKNALDLLARAFGVPLSPPLYAMLTLPGFFLHEGAHALSALVMRVPIRGVTFIPRRAMGDLGVGVSSGILLVRDEPVQGPEFDLARHGAGHRRCSSGNWQPGGNHFSGLAVGRWATMPTAFKTASRTRAPKRARAFRC